MKKLTLFLFVFGILFSVNAQKQTFKYSDSWGNSGFNLESQKSSGVEIVYSVKEFSILETEIKGETLQNINLPGIILFNDAGMPDLPGESKLIAVPEGAKPILKIVDYRTEIVEGVEMAPAPVIPFDTEPNMVYEKDIKVFSQDAFYPADPIKISKLLEIRGVDAVMLGITPFQYNPVTKQLIVYKDIKVEITFEGGKGYFSDNRLRNRVWEPVLNDALLNYSSLPKIDFDAKAKNAKDGEYEYVILTLDNTDFTDWAETIAEFRRKQGISTGVFTISDVPGGNTVSSIETWVDNMYNTWTTPPAAILILADYGTDASGITSQSYPHPYSGTYISDNHYADVDNDDLPDIAFARITANNASQLEVMITKFIEYEESPPTSADFYNHPITALGWQDDRWFQICSEAVGGFWNNELGKETVRINELGIPANNYNSGPWSTATNTSDVMNYFGPSGLAYIPETPQELGGFTGGTATDVNNAINSGSFMLQHRDHGGITGWGEPDYDNSDIDGLTNTDLPFIWSINCLTGQFNYSSECFAEKFHRYTNGGNNSGALGIIAASQVSYSFVNDTYVWGAYDNMWPNFMPAETANPESRFIYPAFANVAGKNFLYQSSWPYNTSSKQITYRLFHHHGDPYLNVYSEVPQNLSVTCPSTHTFGDLTIDITVDNGATIAVTYYNTTDEETVILGTALSSGGATTVNLASCPDPGTNMLVTITKQNYFRYTQNVLVIAPSGPYDVVDGFLINDSGNNEAEFGETFNLDITVKNVGVATSESITATLTTSDTYVESLTNAVNVSIPDLASDTSYTTSGQFTVELANNVPDQHNIQFNLVITDNSTKATYNSVISFYVNAPNFSIGDVFITNDDNTDGILDPGETGDINFTVTNTGHATADFGGTLSESNDPNNYLTLGGTSVTSVTLAPSASQDFTFTGAAADAGTPLGSTVEVQLDMTAGALNQYTEVDNQEIIIGEIPVYLISDGGTLSVCTGVFYDDGGPDGNYSNGVDYTMTFLPGQAGKMIEVDFFGDFQIESCSWDWLTVYDGTDASAAQIAEFCGTTEPTVPITASNGDGALTFVFHSDGSITFNGWSANISCVSESILTAPNSEICLGDNTGDITYTDYSGTITDWEKRLEGGSWTSIGHTSSTYSETPSTAGTWEYQVETDGSTYSDIVSIVVHPVTVGGSVSGGSTICEGESTGTLTLSGHTGDVLRWQKQFDGGTWTDITNNGTTYSETPTEDGTWTYRAVVKSSVCTEENSGSTDVVVDPLVIVGTASATEDEICTGSTATVTLTSYEGNIQWQESGNGTDWSDISGATSDSYISGALTSNMFYRANVSMGSCPDTLSNSVEITVIENPVAEYTFIANNQELSFTNASSNSTGYSWDFGDGTGSTDENPVHTYSASETFTVTLTASNGVCADDVYSEDIAVTFEGIERLESGINIYPNPANGIFNIESFGFSDYILEVCDINGKIIIKRDIHEESSEIDMTKYPKGVYFISVILENEIKTGKLILK